MHHKIQVKIFLETYNKKISKIKKLQKQKNIKYNKKIFEE